MRILLSDGNAARLIPLRDEQVVGRNDDESDGNGRAWAPP